MLQCIYIHIIYTLFSEIEHDQSTECHDTVEKIKQIVGEPRNYGQYHNYYEHIQHNPTVSLYMYVCVCVCVCAGLTAEERAILEQKARVERVCTLY